MFSKFKTLDLLPIELDKEIFLDPTLRFATFTDDTFTIISNTKTSANIKRYSFNGDLISSIDFTDIVGNITKIDTNGDDIYYLCTIEAISEYEENLIIYKSANGKTTEVAKFKRESYLHKMAYFALYKSKSDKDMHILLIRHNRLHKYAIHTTPNDYDKLEEVDILEGERWFIDSAESSGYIVGSVGDNWYLYNLDLDVISSFESDERAVCIKISSSKEKDIVAITLNNYDDTSTLFVYNMAEDLFSSFTISHQLYATQVIGNKIWASLYSVIYSEQNISDISGFLVFDKNAIIQFAHIRNKLEGDLIRAYKPIPITTNTLGFRDLKDNKVMIAEEDKLIITDITCRELGAINIPKNNYIALNSDSSKLLQLSFTDTDMTNPDVVISKVQVNIFNWENVQKATQIIDIKSFRN